MSALSFKNHMCTSYMECSVYIYIVSILNLKTTMYHKLYMFTVKT